MVENKYHHGDLKNELINKGLELFNKVGYEDFSLRKLARICEVSHTAPYRHFNNKDELITVITSEIEQQFAQALRRSQQEYCHDPKIELKEIGKAYVKFFIENPEFFKFLFIYRLYVNVEQEPRQNGNRENSFRIFEKSAKKYLSSISSKDEESVDIVTMWSLVHGLTMLISNGHVVVEKNYMDFVDKVVSKMLDNYDLLK